MSDSFYGRRGDSTTATQALGYTATWVLEEDGVARLALNGLNVNIASHVRSLIPK